MTVWDEWGALTRFLHSARVAFARERQIWDGLQIDNREEVGIAVNEGQSSYRVTLGQHLQTIHDQETLYASVLLHSYALAESSACTLVGLDTRNAGGIEGWGSKILNERGSDWSDVAGGKAGAVEIHVVRNVYAHGGRTVDADAIGRLAKVGHTAWSPGHTVSLDFETLEHYRARLRSLLRLGGVDAPPKGRPR